MSLYAVFDDFCRTPTWDTGHPSDLQKFSAALRLSNKHQEFDPSEMSTYIRANHADPIWQRTPTQINKTIADLERRARAAKSRKT